MRPTKAERELSPPVSVVSSAAMPRRASTSVPDGRSAGRRDRSAVHSSSRSAGTPSVSAEAATASSFCLATSTSSGVPENGSCPVSAR